MAETKKPSNVYQKLMAARIAFAKSDPIKSGKNTDLKYRYFELEDIVPTAQQIFQDLGLIALCSFTKESATMTIVDMDTPGQTIVFNSPMKDWEGNRAVNPLQTVGASETYQRRYLYMMALDICERDDIDVTPAVTTPPAQATAAKREEITKTLTNPNGDADSVMLGQLKDIMQRVQSSLPERQQWCESVSKATQGFTVVSKDMCAALIQRAGDLLKGGGSK